MENLKAHRHVAGVFFNALTNLNKFVAYEQRDPFMIKNELTENPDFTEWDRFAQHEYVRLALEEENAENVNVATTILNVCRVECLIQQIYGMVMRLINKNLNIKRGKRSY